MRGQWLCLALIEKATKRRDRQLAIFPTFPAFFFKHRDGQSFSSHMVLRESLEDKAVLVSLSYHDKKHRLGHLNYRNECFQSSGGWKSKIKVLEDLFFPGASPLILKMISFLLCPHMVVSLSVHISGISLCVRTSFSCKDISQIVLKALSLEFSLWLGGNKSD